MEKVKKSNLFPPLAIPEAYKRRKLNTGLSKEGQTVKNELENKHIIDHFLRQNISKELEKAELGVTAKDKRLETFCVACAQRVSLQPPRRPTSRERRHNAPLSKEKMMGCICIMCKKALPLSPHAAGNHRIIINNSVPEQDEEGNIGAREVIKEFSLQKDFRISSLDYDSRIEDMQYRVDNEHCMPPKEVIRRSERKCQLWLLRNEEHIRVGTSPRFKGFVQR